MQPILALIAANPQIADKEPLRRGGPILGPALNGGLQHIKPGRQVAGGLLQGQARGDIAVQHAVQLPRASPNLGSARLGKAILVPQGNRPAEQRILHAGQNRPVADLAEAQIDLIRIDRDQRHRRPRTRWQHISPPGKPDRGRTIPHIDLQWHCAA